MAYLVKLMAIDGKTPWGRVQRALEAHVKKDGRFVCEVTGPTVLGKGPHGGSRKEGVGFRVSRVRLLKAKPYCGQHPGVCFGAGPKKSMKYLEWDDWVAFHNLVNDCLDRVHPFADVSTQPHEAPGIMWVRKGFARRLKWDWEDDWSTTHGGGPRQTWNLGTPDQFQVCDWNKEGCDGPGT